MATLRDIKLDASGDFAIEGADLATVSDGEAISQAISIRLQFFRGEWFLDQDAGIPYFDDVLVKSPDLNLVRSIFRAAILETPGVTGLPALDLSLNRSTRKLAVSFSATTDAGLLTTTVEV